jgi:hypothetical protein
VLFMRIPWRGNCQDCRLGSRHSRAPDSFSCNVAVSLLTGRELSCS